MEFLNLVFIFYAGYLILKKPEKESFIKKMLIATIAIFIFNCCLFLYGTVTPPIVL